MRHTLGRRPFVRPLATSPSIVTILTYPTVTTHTKHATEIVRELDLGKYDAIVTMSGDGLIYEVLNGLAEHKNPVEALRTPITPIPTGSGNGLSLNLLGLKEGTDVSLAAVNAIKGNSE